MTETCQYLRPDGSDHTTLTPTQFIHEWVHYLEGKGYDIADGSRGKPSYPADKDAAKAILHVAEGLFWGGINTSPYGKYTIGEKEFRAKAAEGLKREYGFDFNPENVIFTAGGQFAIAAIFNAIEKENPDSVIITPSPWYTNHYELAHLFNDSDVSKFKKIDLLETKDFRLNGEMVKKASEEVIAEGRKIGAFLFCNPMNPLSLVTRKKEWQSIVAVLKNYPQVPIILDEAFAEIIFDNDAEWSLLHAAPELIERCFLMRSGTKALGFSGERLALMYCPDKYMQAITRLQSRLIGNASLSSQAGMSEAMYKMTREKKAQISAYYASNAEYLYSELAKIGVLLSDKLKPEGCFYTLIDLSKLIGKNIPEEAQKFCHGKKIIENDIDIALSLLHGMNSNSHKGLALIPASFFGVESKKGVMRVSFSSNRKELQNIINNLSYFLGL